MVDKINKEIRRKVSQYIYFQVSLFTWAGATDVTFFN